MKLPLKIFLFLTIFTLTGCSLFPERVVYQQVYVKPEVSGLQSNCSISQLDRPPTKDYLISLKSDEARFIYISGLYIQSLGVLGKCIKETEGVVTYVNTIDKKSEDVK